MADTCNTKGHGVVPPRTGRVTIWSCTRCRGRDGVENSLRALKFHRGARPEPRRPCRTSMADRERRSRRVFSPSFSSLSSLSFGALPVPQETVTKSRALLANPPDPPEPDRSASNESAIQLSAFPSGGFPDRLIMHGNLRNARIFKNRDKPEARFQLETGRNSRNNLNAVVNVDREFFYGFTAAN